VEATGRRAEPLSVCTIGDLNLDVIVRPAAALRADSDTPATIRLCPGGQAANVAAWAAALGARSRLICARGSDHPSRLAGAELARRGVDVCGPILNARGGVVVSIADGSSGRTMASDRSAAAGLTGADIDPVWVESCDVLHVSGYCLMREPMAQAAITAARRARRVTVDLASAHDIELVGAEWFSERLRELGAETAFATEAERAAVPDYDTSWVIKRGAAGARFPEGDFAADPVDVIDATGAGDALAAGWLAGGPELAMRAARLCLGQIGGMPPVEGAAGLRAQRASH
jgi:sugar/nucleoside kinase (ribokinase family)